MIPMILLCLLTAWVLYRRRRRNVLAGRNALKPTYTVEPPARRVGSRKRESL